MANKPEHPDFPQQDQSSALVWDAFRRGRIWITYGKGGPRFTFAAGAQAEVKGDAGRLHDSPKEHGLVLGLLAVHPCVAWADAIAPVPNGMNDDGEEISDRLEKDVIRMYRPQGASSRYDLRFCSLKDKRLAQVAGKVCELEDLSSTGSTPFEQAKILRKQNPALRVHSLSMMQRATLRAEYQEGPDAIKFHTLCVPPQPIPLDYDSFVHAFDITPVKISPSE